jgi:flagellar biosynthetic protein FliR
MIQVWIVLFALILARVGTFVGVLPLFGSSQVPRIVKVGLAMALSLPWFVSYGLTPDPNLVRQFAEPHWLALGLAVTREAILGAVLALVLGLVQVPARIAGEFLSQEIGLTLGGILDPTSGQSASSLTLIFEMLGSLVLLSLDVHHVFFAALHETFVRWPLGGDFVPVPARDLVRESAAAQEWGVLLAAPIVLCLFLTSIVLALLAKAAPQMNFFSVGFVVRLAVGLVAALVLLPDLIAGLAGAMGQLAQVAFRLE